MQTLGIVGAMQVEIDAILPKLKNVTEKTHAGQKYYAGKLGNTEVVVTCSGIGKVNAAIATQCLIDNYGPDAIINTGIAGNLSNELHIGDVVVSSAVTYHDFDSKLLEKFYPHKVEFTADKKLIELAQNAIEQGTEKPVKQKTGLVITGDIFLEDTALKNELTQKYGALCVEMEGAAIAHCCAKNDVPFVIIRSISDNADDGAQEVYENFEKEVAHFTANIVVYLVEKLS